MNNQETRGLSTSTFDLTKGKRQVPTCSLLRSLKTMAAPCVDVERLTRALNEPLSELGFECHPLKIGWYNKVLPSSLHLHYHDDTVAMVVLSMPAMFERAFLPFMETNRCQGLSDPVDQCVKHCISTTIAQCFPGQKVEVSYDFEMLPSRKPKFLAQTAAHVSGAAFYYQQSDVTEPPWGNKKRFGVCVHPRFGGWFAIRALLVFEGVEVGAELQKPSSPDCVPSRDARIRLLDDFNLRWQDWSYRDAVPSAQTYSQKQRDYFSTPPAQRPSLLRTWGFLHDQDSKDGLLGPQHDGLGPANGHG